MKIEKEIRNKAKRVVVPNNCAAIKAEANKEICRLDIKMKCKVVKQQNVPTYFWTVATK